MHPSWIALVPSSPSNLLCITGTPTHCSARIGLEENRRREACSCQSFRRPSLLFQKRLCHLHTSPTRPCAPISTDGAPVSAAAPEAALRGAALRVGPARGCLPRRAPRRPAGPRRLGPAAIRRALDWHAPVGPLRDPRRRRAPQGLARAETRRARPRRRRAVGRRAPIPLQGSIGHQLIDDSAFCLLRTCFCRVERWLTRSATPCFI